MGGVTTYVVSRWTCRACGAGWERAEFLVGEPRFRVASGGPDVCPGCGAGRESASREDGGVVSGLLPDGCLLSFGEAEG